MSTFRQDSGFTDGYDIVEAPDFLQRVESEIGDVRRWDEMRRGFDAWMNQMPTGLPVSRHIREDLWFVRVKTDPLVLLLYQVDEIERVVTYLNLQVFHDEVEDLDPAFDDLL
jgi:hypothetical protein